MTQSAKVTNPAPRRNPPQIGMIPLISAAGANSEKYDAESMTPPANPSEVASNSFCKKVINKYPLG